MNSNFLLICCLRRSNYLSLGLWWQSIIWYFCYVFSNFSLQLKTNQMRVRGGYNDYRNILYCIHSSRCNWVLSELMQIIKSRRHVKNQGWIIEDQGFLEGCWRQYKVKKIHFKFLWVFRWKDDRKQEENARNRTWGAASGALHLSLCALLLRKAWPSISLLPQAPCAPRHVPFA